MRRFLARYQNAFGLGLFIIVFPLVSVLVGHFGFGVAVINAYESIHATIDPSPLLLYEYGTMHFDANDPVLYDIPLAEEYFYAAASRDPDLPYVYHEIARIEFLKGNFALAMAEIDVQIDMQGDETPNSYYVRGLIEGYRGDYPDAVRDYGHFLQFDPIDWAAINDFAWVLLKDGRTKDALTVTSAGLVFFPANPWLLNSNAIALYGMGEKQQAVGQAQKAIAAVSGLTDADWLDAYPGNDPRIAAQGLQTFKDAVSFNMQAILAGDASSSLKQI